MKIITIVLCLVLSGCMTSKSVALPDGSQGLSISCPGAARSIADCMDEAAKECAGPYRVISQDQSSPGAVAIPVGNMTAMGAAMHRLLIVKCGK